MTFGEAATARRLELGLSQAALARRAGLSQPHVCRLLNDTRPPSPEAATKLVDALALEGPARTTLMRLAGEAAGYVTSPAG